MEDEERDPTGVVRHECKADPSLTFYLAPVLSTPWNFAIDRCRRRDQDGTRQLDTRTLHGWFLRFSTVTLDGLTWPGKRKIPDSHEVTQIMVAGYPILSTAWFDRLSPEVIDEVGNVVLDTAELTPTQKKTSDWPSSGTPARTTTDPGTADDATSSRESATGSSPRAVPRST